MRPGVFLPSIQKVILRFLCHTLHALPEHAIFVAVCMHAFCRACKVWNMHLRVDDACSASSWQVVFGPTKRNVSLPFPLTCNCPTGQPDKVDGQLCFDDGIGLEILSPRLATPRSMQSHSDIHRRKNTVYTEMVSPASSQQKNVV